MFLVKNLRFFLNLFKQIKSKSAAFLISNNCRIIPDSKQKSFLLTLFFFKKFSNSVKNLFCKFVENKIK